ncbi:MAG: hypothetical protein GW893_12995 [Armatimonadetes bacterium]|nr:hypothetical protein [Armatimonadota bacterium]PIU60250.1 MAG: hypothetical protein COS85_25390 [Armatimonadetes bacterium CG07_land_8_20_14_0_80_59_28]PIX41450.1 MAG: hypothetical protein COZ56_12055 [Armatimonadetes bacterium CG_4_8_14_3_um_filter_58_9]
MNIYDLDTPALLVDVDILERNLRKMAAITAETGTRVRPHSKVYKCIEIVRKQLELGAMGVTCSKLSEAEVLADHGIDNLLVANEVVGQPKIQRLIDLVRRVDVMVGVDHPLAVDALNAAATDASVRLPVLVDMDIGMKRNGIAPEDAAELVRKVVASRGLEFRGLMGYEGHLVSMPPGEEKTNAVNEALDRFSFVIDELKTDGIDVPIVSAGGTGDYQIAARHPAVTELQVGTYAVMDTLYGSFTPEFELATTILCTVTSRPCRERLILDVGRKAVNTALSTSTLKDRPTVEMKYTYAEHGAMTVDEDAPDLIPGVKVELVVPYACGTIHMYEQMHIVRDGEVVDIWPVVGRGKVQ